MNILGISFLPESSVTVLKDGKVVAAISEERLNRVKQAHGFPKLAIDAALKISGLTLDQIDYVATHGQAAASPDETPFQEKEREILDSSLSAGQKELMLGALRQRLEHEKKVYSERTPGFISEVRALSRPMKVFAHHKCHAATGFYGSGWEECIILTADGWGEDGSSTLWRGRGIEMEAISSTPSIDSLGYFYGSITKALGFIPHRHEGKILGLAAYCSAPKSLKSIGDMIGYNAQKMKFVSHMDRGMYMPRFENPILKDFVKGFSREDVAAAAQMRLEEVVCGFVNSLGSQPMRLAVAGGIFANVKLNQRLKDLPNVEELFVFPNMGDGGLSTGAAWLAHAELQKSRPAPLETLYLGPESTESEIGRALQESGLQHEHLGAGIADKVGALVAEGHVVAHCDGRMEFGPRALGNRTIIVQAIDPTVNTWLNQRLNRSEFMPFAPATLSEHADECYVGLDGGRMSARHMTLTFDCTLRMREQSGAAVHVDGTARPQLVSKKESPRFHDIISAYYKRTGIPSVINTSFNMHEEPIVCSVDDAIRAFVDGSLPYLAVGEFLVTNSNS